MSFSAASCSRRMSVLFMPTAQTPLSKRISTWSFISEMSGLTTTVMPSRASAVSWKQRLLPEPVGMTTRVSRPSRAEWTASACPGRNRRKPKVFAQSVRQPAARSAAVCSQMVVSGHSSPPARPRTTRGLGSAELTITERGTRAIVDGTESKRHAASQHQAVVPSSQTVLIAPKDQTA